MHLADVVGLPELCRHHFQPTPRSPVAPTTASGGGREAVHQILRSRAGVGDAAEPADVVVHPRRVGAYVDVAAGPGGSRDELAAKDGFENCSAGSVRH